VKGDLAEGVIPALLQELYVGRRSGTIQFARGSERQSVRLRHGHIVNAQSNVPEDRLGEMLVRRGLLSPADLTRATEVVVKEHKRLGQVLLELELMNQNGLEDAIPLHVHEMLSRLFTWGEGTYEFVEETDETGEELTLKLSTAELILEAVQAIQDPDVVRYLLGDLERVLALSNDPLLRFQKATLSPADGFVLSRVDGTTSAREILQMIPLPAEVVQKSLLALLSTGIIEHGSARKPRAPVTAPRAAPPAVEAEPLPPAARTAASPPPPAAPPPAPPVVQVPAASAPAAGPAATVDDKTEERRREVLEAWEGLKTHNHFEVLGIPRASGEAEVKEAYFRLARRFHPDAHHAASLGDLRDKLEQVFIHLGEAYEVLRDPKRRAEYEERLGRSQPRPREPAAAATAPEAGPPAPPPDPEDEARLAEEAIRRAERLYEKGQYFDAIQLLQPAIEAAKPKMKQRGRIALARCYLTKSKLGKDAEETLLAVTKEDPQNVDAHALLAGLYRDRGLRTRATAMYRRVLELNPEHEEAAQFLAGAAPSPPPPEEGGGLLGRLFRKG